MPFFAHIDTNGRVLLSGYTNAAIRDVPPFDGAAAVETEQLLPVDDGRAPPTYAHLRLEAYPSIGDQLDALWRGGPALDAMREQILAVKARYPKPG
ncbi:MAG: hypothetical protein JO278_04590 [Dyella sp.]|nr:hypothetical protein [Dyella sp.]